MKKIIISFVMCLVGFMIGFTMGNNKQEEKTDDKKVTIERIITQTTDTFYIEDGEIGIEFSDGSWASVNEKKGYYVFQPYVMGDWSYDFDNLKDFEKCVSAYLENN